MGKYVNQLYVLDFLGVLSAITQMQFIKLHRGERGLEGIHLKGPVLTMFTYVPAALNILYPRPFPKERQ